MKAPKKIYLHPTAKGEVGANWLTFELTNEDVKYVRADAFIERAEEWLKLFLNNSVCIKDVGERAKRVIVDDFRKAMKGK